MPYVLLISHYTNLQNPKYIICNCGKIIENTIASCFYQNRSTENCVILCQSFKYLFLCLNNSLYKTYSYELSKLKGKFNSIIYILEKIKEE
jgi:hypothetical protein